MVLSNNGCFVGIKIMVQESLEMNMDKALREV